MNNKPVFPRMHVSLYVKDLDKTIAFYEKFFNKAADKIKPAYAKFMLDQPALIISFVENPKKVQPVFGHLGIQVETLEEMEQKLQVAVEAGLIIKEKRDTNCCYAKQDKFWVADPDGVQWEVYYFHEDVAFNDPNYTIENSEVCCMPPVSEKVKEKPKLRIKLSDLAAQNSDTGICEPGSGCC